MERKAEEEIQKYIDEMNEVYEHVLIYMDNPDPVSEEDYTNLLHVIDTHGIERNKEQFQHIISLFVNIANNHHRQAGFFDKIERILSRYQNKIQENNTNIEIYEKFASNKRLIYFLIKKEILKIDEQITRELNSDNNRDFFIKEITQNETDKDGLN